MRGLVVLFVVACGGAPTKPAPAARDAQPTERLARDATERLAPAARDAREPTERLAPAESARPEAEAVATSTPPPPAALPLGCHARESGKGFLEVNIDPTTLTGTLYRVTTGPAPQRKINVTATLRGDAAILVFKGYAEGDSTTIRNKRARRPPKERLVRGKSIVARLVSLDGRTKIFLDGDVDFVTGAHPVIEGDGSTPCT